MGGKGERMTSVIHVDGLTIEYDDGELRVNGKVVDISNVKGVKPSKTVEITKDQIIDADFSGNIKITGNNVKLIIKGDVDGNITGAGNIEVGRDVDGNIVGCNQVNVSGDIDGNIIGCSINKGYQKSKGINK